jgi:hypothetical protein
MKISNEQLLDIIADASQQLFKEIKRAYKSGNLEGYLSSIGMRDLYPSKDETIIYDTNPDGKIIIFGDSRIKDHEIYGCLKELGISKDRIELQTSYEKIKKYPFRNIQYNPNYRLILFGAIPHSGEGKQDKSSIITQVEDDDGYPKVIRLTDGHRLKITKTNLKKTIIEEIESGYLVV